MWGRAIVLLVLALSGCSVTSDLNDLKGGVAMDAGTQQDAAEESAHAPRDETPREPTA